MAMVESALEIAAKIKRMAANKANIK